MSAFFAARCSTLAFLLASAGCLVPVDEHSCGLCIPASQGPFATIAQGGRDSPATTIFQGKVNVFVHDSTNLDLLWCADAASECAWQTLDGSGGPDGRIVGDVAAECMTAFTWGDKLHLFYRQDTAGSGHTLRHGLLSGSAWSFETLDGNGGAGGRTTNRVGGCPSAASFGSRLFIGFYDYDAHAFRVGSFNDLDWDFLSLDGNSGPNGRIDGDIGYWSSMVAVSGSLHAYYADRTHLDLREAWWDGSGDWDFGTRSMPQGILGNSIGSWRIAAVVHQGVPHVFYGSIFGDLRHAWSTPPWNYEVFDGDSTAGGRTNHGVGLAGVSAASSGPDLHVFYYDVRMGDLRHAWGTGASAWSYETADGHSSLDGRVDGIVGRKPVATSVGGRVYVFYEHEGTTPSIRQARY